MIDSEMRPARQQSIQTSRLVSRVSQSWRTLSENRMLIDQLGPLWISGLVLMAVAIVYLATGGPEGILPRKLFDWSLYFALGVAIAVAMLLMIVDRFGPQPASWRRWVYPSLSAVALVGLSALVLIPERWAALPLAAIQLAWTVQLVRSRGKPDPGQLVLMSIVAVLAWIAALPLLWWEPMLPLLAAQPLAGVIVVAAVIGTTSWAFNLASSGEAKTPLWTQRLERGIDIVAVVSIVSMSIRTDGLFLAGDPFGTMHHWGVFTGAAQAVREGGFLLWDVPAQYGFLSTLILAVSPGESLWQSLYLLNGVSLILVGLAIYGVLRAVRPDWIGKLVALGATLAGVYLAATWAQSLSPIHYHPSFGPYRYIWCFALLAVIAFAVRQHAGSRAESAGLAVGTVCWLLGAFWSFESAVFSSVIWFPAFGTIVAQRTGLLSRFVPDSTEESGTRAVVRFLGWMLMPIAVLAAALAVTATVYLQNLGHLPDPRSYVEYVASFGSGYVSELAGETVVLNPTDAHLAIALALVLLFSTVGVVLRASSNARNVLLLITLGIAVWFVSTYSIGRPDPHTVSRSWPFLLLAAGVSLLVLGHRADWRSGMTVRAAAAPLVAMLLILTYTNVSALRWHASVLQLPGMGPWPIENGLPVADEALAELITRAQLTADTPILYDGSAGGNLMPMWYSVPDGAPVALSRAWLPAPLAALIVLPEDRRQTYMARMIDRRQSGGWYVHRADDRDLRGAERWAGSGQWFFDQLAKTHVPTRALQNKDWQLVWFEYVGESPGVPRPQIGGGQLAESPAVLWIDRRSITSGQDLGIWMIPGEGWGNDGSTRKLSLSFPATASIFSDRDRDVTVKLTSGKQSRLPKMDVELNGEDVGSVRRAGASAGLIDLTLRQGWNIITLQTPSTANVGNGVVDEPPIRIEIARIDILTRGER